MEEDEEEGNGCTGEDRPERMESRSRETTMTTPWDKAMCTAVLCSPTRQVRPTAAADGSLGMTFGRGFPVLPGGPCDECIAVVPSGLKYHA